MPKEVNSFGVNFKNKKLSYNLISNKKTLCYNLTLQNKGFFMYKTVVAFTLASLFSSSLMAYDLKSNMLLLNAELSEVQRAFISSDQKGVDESIKRFAKHAQDLLGSKEKFASMLPDKKKNKAGEAVMSAQIISHNVQIILDAVENKYNQSGQVRREEAQRAYTYIEHACFRCHNLVRDEY